MRKISSGFAAMAVSGILSPSAMSCSSLTDFRLSSAMSTAGRFAGGRTTAGLRATMFREAGGLSGEPNRDRKQGQASEVDEAPRICLELCHKRGKLGTHSLHLDCQRRIRSGSRNSSLAGKHQLEGIHL